ncbi:MFS transporter [Streptomyces sp. NBC_00193]|uniref:MFS transporter n=1 Tax=Streptomyces sp. NBC_00193 TaxID=2975675 RepID=UPI0022534098|nr:MFS transporter [Streptomyces sp. NBC_00193]MCX5300541.1 MFS transporter [Streptomyces sp. NBC_00193]
MRAEASTAARKGAFIAVAVALFCIQLDFFALNLAIPGIAAELGVTVSAAQWTLSAYMLAIGCFFIIGGRVGDVFGRRGTLLAGTTLFTAGTVGCALAPGLGPLVVARIAQGVGAAFVFPVAVSVITNTFPEESRAKALGGGFTEGPGWRWIFWLMAPLSLLSLLTALAYVPDSRDAAAPRELDVLGCALIVGALAALTLTVERADAWGWSSARVFLAPALLVALSGPLGARLGRHMRPTTVMALAGIGAGTGMYALTQVSAWWLYVPVFAWCGLGLGLGWTYASVATQQLVAPARAGEASGVLLTFLVTGGAIALAGTAAGISAMTPQRSPEEAYDVILRLGGVAVLATALLVLAVRRRVAAQGRTR